MAELAAAGSIVGLISLSIQSCQGLTSYYSAWKSYDEQISHTHRQLDELRIICESLKREIQRITQDQEPTVQQVIRLIASCQDGIGSLGHDLEQCRSVQIPQTLTAKVKMHHARALYPFKKQTLQRLEANVHAVRGNLSSALQTLQLHLSAGYEQKLTSLASTASSTETAVHDNQKAIQALSLPLNAINSAMPLIQQQNDCTALTIRAVRDEAHSSRQGTRNFREKVLRELTELTDRVESSPTSTNLERSIAMTLDHYSAEMNQLKHDLHFASSQATGEMVAKLEAIDQSVKSLQIGLISKPGLMQSVCKENDRLEKSSGPGIGRREAWLGSNDKRTKRRQKCKCPLKNSTYAARSSRCFGLWWGPEWNFLFERESMSHDPSCHLFTSSPSATLIRLRVKNCGAILTGALEASISIKRGAGGLSVSPILQCARRVSADSHAFRLVDSRQVYYSGSYIRMKKTGKDLELTLRCNVNELARLFRDGKASPYDVDVEGKTLLHKACWLLEWVSCLAEEESGEFLGIIVWFLVRLIELGVPLNWTDDDDFVFLNRFIYFTFDDFKTCDLVASTTRLLDSGAECTNFSPGRLHRRRWVPPLMTVPADFAELAKTLEDNELSIAISYRSERELDEVLREMPLLINQVNKLGNTPLHLAAVWPYAVRVLLQNGASVNATDLDNHTPLFYAMILGITETVSLLMKADCSTQLGYWDSENSFLSWAISRSGYEGVNGGISQETRMDVVNTVIVMLAERRRNLQMRLAALSIAVSINPSVFQNDRVLDEYAQYAETVEEAALRRFDHQQPYASSLLPNCRTVYHVENLTVEIAEKLWWSGFRDIDVPDRDGRTPLMIYRHSREDEPFTEIDVCSWLIQKGAKLHRRQHELETYNSHDTTLAIHYVAGKIGHYGCGFAREDWGFRIEHREQRWNSNFDRLNEDEKRFLTTILLDISSDSCICACSSLGCLASTVMLKKFEYTNFGTNPKRECLKLALLYLHCLVGAHDTVPDWLVKEIIRYLTFTELELRHTCCRWNCYRPFKRPEPEECVEIRDEDHEKIELLESLLQEFEENRGSQDLMLFVEEYWTTRMDQVLQEQGSVDEEALREIGVVLYEDDKEDDDEEDKDEEDEDEEDEDDKDHDVEDGD